MHRPLPGVISLHTSLHEVWRVETVRDSDPALMAGVPELLILKLLAGREMYGYELAAAIRTVTN